MKVAWVGTFDPTFSRNQRLRRHLELAGVETTVVRVDLWGANRLADAASHKVVRLLRAIPVYATLIVRLLRIQPPDLYLVSYPGWFDVPIVATIARLRKRPVVFDPFFLLYETAIEDRAMFNPSSVLARWLKWVDGLTLRLADLILADTSAHLAYYQKVAHKQLRGRVVEVGADDSVFMPNTSPSEGNEVLFYGNFVPLQGVPTIVDAAVRLKNENIRFTLIGNGQDREKVEQLITSSSLPNVELHDAVTLHALPDFIARASVVLGIFGDSPKADRVVPHKVYEAMASGKAIITRKSSAIEGTIAANEVLCVEPADSEALAGAIRKLCQDLELRTLYESSALVGYQARFHERVLSRKLGDALREIRGQN